MVVPLYLNLLVWRVLVIFSGEIKTSWPPFDSISHRREDQAEQMHEQMHEQTHKFKWDVCQKRFVG